MTRALPWLALILALGACDGGGGGSDAGAPPTGVVLSVTGAARRADINGVVPRPGFEYLLLDAVIEARGVGPIPIAPFAFEVTLEDATRITADSRTNELADGCRSRNLAVDETHACRLAFTVALDAAPASTLRWSDGSRSAVAPVPAP
ncbi:MAG: hypothetical protein KF729_16305 [Sandaracinaceae bacterium]|nr:hypothetical protein [Sandaracinaceae bacterium]